MHWSNLYEEELRDLMVAQGQPAFRGTQVFEALHRQNKTKEEVTNLPKDFLEGLAPLEDRVKIERVFVSEIAGTRKMIYRLGDGQIIEGVLMSYKHGYSLCLSSQVGCRMGCSFCASGVNGLSRNLKPYEMASQVYEVEKYFDIVVSNIILMGSGEPLDNYDNVLRFIRLIHEEKGRNLSYRSITLSTCGLVPGILALAREDIPIGLAISLHYTDQAQRSQVMPVARSYDLASLKSALEDYYARTRLRVTIEYTLIQGENDRARDVRGLRDFVERIHAHINLIPLNPVSTFDKTRPSRDHVEDFKRRLEGEGLSVSVRRELGPDISASCGQLKAAYSLGS